MDGTIPRAVLPQMLDRISQLSEQYGLICCNVFHAGDGNLHPLIVFDRREPGVMDRVYAAGQEILETCVAAGGMLSGEHGIGLEKRDAMPLVFTAVDLAIQDRVRSAFDPAGRCNPEKVLPTGSRCGDIAELPPGAWV